MRDEEKAFDKHTQSSVNQVDQIRFLRELEFALELFTKNLKATFKREFKVPLPTQTINLINNMFSRGLLNNGR